MAETSHEILTRAAAAFNGGDVANAEALCRRSLALDPRAHQGWVLLGRVRTRLARWAEAEEALNHALRLAPEDAEVSFSLGVLRLREGRYVEAMPLLERTERLNPKHAGARSARASCHLYLGEARKALDLIGTPMTMEACITAGQAALALDQGEVAEQNLRAAIEFGGNPNAMYKAHQMLSRVLAVRGDHKGAFEEVLKARALVPTRFDINVADLDIARLQDAFSAAALARLPRATVLTRRPVFIVGMPRSGTTLLEKMIASHPNGAGAGETDALRRQVDQWRKTGDPSTVWPAVVAKFDNARLDEVANKYLEATEIYGGEGIERIADKNLVNWLNTGLIAIAFPAATIIHIRRDPIDTGLSCFERLNPSATPWSADLTNIGHMLALNERLMAHWHDVLPGRLIDVQYEDLARDPANVLKSVLQAIGLPWNDACARQHERTPRVGAQEPPPTLSADQVRRPVYDTSIGRAELFGALLDPLRTAYAAARRAP